ncbi:hypothetical protein [Marmoricola sp. RAF53]|uniref:hypothetical protein n=1 Tax=Marmoricola sp. RAF53 TaxID=3233059 RepID=UPI003F9C3438
MEILLWLLPAVVVTGTAMLVAGWAGRERPEREPSQAEQDRFAEAILRPLPNAARPRPGADARSRPRERSTGVAVRRSGTRRSA